MSTTQKRLMQELGITMETGPKPQVASSKKIPPAVAPKPSYAYSKDLTSNYKQQMATFNDFPPPPPQSYSYASDEGYPPPARTNYNSAHYQNVADFPPPPSNIINTSARREESTYNNYSQLNTPSSYNAPQQRASPQPVSMSYQTTTNRPTYTYGSHQASSRPAHPTQQPSPYANPQQQITPSSSSPRSPNSPPVQNPSPVSTNSPKSYQNGHQSSKPVTPSVGQQTSVSEAEVDALTNLLLQNMEATSEPDFYGMCTKCHNSVIGEKHGCTAMDRVYHIDCFVCQVCCRKLKGLPFFALEGEPYCEPCYMNTLEKCSVCAKAITDRILRATGKPYHPECFTCIVCRKSLDGVPFTVDASNKVHCIEDFHKKFAPRCCVCHLPIMPEDGQEETVRVVAMDRSFHVHCYKCEDCSLVLSSEAEGRGCYPLDSHILCKICNTQRIQAMTHQMTTEL